MQYPIPMGQTPSGIVTMPMTGQAQSGMMKAELQRRFFEDFGGGPLILDP